MASQGWGAMEILKPEDAAAFLGVDRRIVTKLPNLLRVALGPRTIRFDKVDLVAYRRQMPLPTDAGGLAKLIGSRIGEHAHHGTPGFIYFMQCRELVKIGFSSEPANRREGLQSVIPFEITLLGSVPGSVPAERELHVTFASIKYERLTEWFYHSSALLEAIQIITQQGARSDG